MQQFAPDNGGGSTPSSVPFTPYASGSGFTYPTYADVQPRILTLAPPGTASDVHPWIALNDATVGSPSSGTTSGGATGQETGGTTATGNFGAVLDLFRNMFSSNPNTAALSQQTGTPVLVQNGASSMSGKTILILVIVAGAAWYAHRRGVI